MKKKKEIVKNIPDDIKVLFGKHFVFSMILIVILILYPILVLRYCSIYSKIGILCFLFIFYGYMLFNLFRKRKNFMSVSVPLTIFIIIFLFIFDLVKLIMNLT